jgi:hypothetical protein
MQKPIIATQKDDKKMFSTYSVKAKRIVPAAAQVLIRRLANLNL